MLRQTLRIKVTQSEKLSVSFPADRTTGAKDVRTGGALERIVAALADAWRRASR